MAPALARWRDRLAEVTGVRPRLAGSGSSWFVEGDGDGLGIAGRDFLVIDGRAGAAGGGADGAGASPDAEYAGAGLTRHSRPAGRE